MQGNSVSTTARALGVRRQLVSEWLNTPGPFQTEYRRQRVEALAAGRQALQSLLDTAINVVADALTPGNDITVRLKAAAVVFQNIGLNKWAPPLELSVVPALDPGDVHSRPPGEANVIPLKKIG